MFTPVILFRDFVTELYRATKLPLQVRMLKLQHVTQVHREP